MMRALLLTVGFLLLDGSFLAQVLDLSVTAVIPVGQPFGGPYSVAAGDFDEDGKPDVAVGDYHGQALVILPGIGDGTFRTGTRIPLDTSVRQIAVSDLDRDGHLDIVATCVKEDDREPVSNWVNEVVVLLGRGDGTFLEPSRISVSSSAWGILAADLDGDGVPDLAVGQAAKILLMMGRGDGTFRDPVELPTPVRGYSDAPVIEIRAADLNLDDKPDLVAVHEISGPVSVLLSAPAGGYRGQVLQAPGNGYTHDVAIADFNQDGKSDLAVCGEGGCLIFTGNGDGTFRQQGSFDEPARPLVVAAGDLNGDGLPDLVLGNYYGGKISVLLGNGDGTFHEMPAILAKGDTFGLVITDLDGDGWSDVVAANHSSQSVTVALGQGEGKFRAAMTLASAPPVLTAADLDGDGRAELVAVDRTSDTVSVLRGTGELVGKQFVESNPDRAFVADLNGDGIPDLIVPGGRRGPGGSWLTYATLLRGTGNALFENAGMITPAMILASADFDGDGRADLATTDFSSRIQLSLGNGDGSFVPVGQIETPGGLGAVAVADFNRDGLPDLAVASQSGVLVFLNQGGGTFRAAAPYAFPDRPATIFIADFNADRIPDVAVVLSNSVCILWGAEEGSLQAGPCTSVAWAGAAVAGDFNGDGRTDLAVVETTLAQYDPEAAPSSTIWVLLGTGDGNFQPPLKAWSGANSRLSSLVAADLDGDGAAELAAALYGYGDFGTSVLVLSGRASGTASTKTN